MKNILKAFLLTLVFACLIGCATTTSGVSTTYFDPEMSEEEKKETVADLKEEYRQKSVKSLAENYELLGPAEGCVIFGCGLQKPVIIQQNPKFGYRFYYGNWKTSKGILGSLFHINGFTTYVFQPLPVDSEVKFYKGETTSYWSYGDRSGEKTSVYFFGIAGVDLKTTKPGLYYLPYNDSDGKYEKRSLKYLKKVYKDTEWEPVIEARIKELKK